jgi:hypothetical protein
VLRNREGFRERCALAAVLSWPAAAFSSASARAPSISRPSGSSTRGIDARYSACPLPVTLRHGQSPRCLPTNCNNLAEYDPLGYNFCSKLAFGKRPSRRSARWSEVRRLEGMSNLVIAKIHSPAYCHSISDALGDIRWIAAK